MAEKKNKGGRPRLFSSPEKMQKKIDQYFNEYVGPTEPPTITGLCFYLGFCDRKGFSEYAKYPEFTDTVKRAKLRIENYLEKRLYWDGPVTGPIFNLKNNFGWKDRVDFTSDDEKVNVTQINLVAPDDSDKS